MSKKADEKTVEKIVGKHRFNALKKAFGLEYAFVDATLADGTVVKVEPAIEEGATVVVVDSEGVENPAPNGEHQLEDGSVIVTEGGVIIEVVAAPEVPSEEEMSTEESKDGISPELTGILSDVASRLKDLESKFKSQTEILSKVEAIEKKVNEFKSEAFASAEDLKATKADLESAKELVVKMANQSEKEPLRKPKQTKASMSNDDAIVDNFKSVLFNKK